MARSNLKIDDFQWVDTELEQLSSRKLWDVLRLAELWGCELDAEFIAEVKTELKKRDIYALEQPWKLPH